MAWAAVLPLSDADETTIAIAALTALVTMLATLPLRVLLGARLNRNRERTKWEFEQRRDLRKKIGEFHGRLLEAATAFNYRMLNIDDCWTNDWLRMDGEFAGGTDSDEFFRTTVHRFLVLQGLITRFQREVTYIDTRIGKRADQQFLFFLKALQWTMTDPKLFDGLEYDRSAENAHFFTDNLHRMSAAAWTEGGTPIPWDQFVSEVQTGTTWSSALEFFDGIEPGDLRWDRLRAYRLVLMGFINTFGYRMQRSPSRWFEQVALEIQHPEVAANLHRWLPKFGLARLRWVRTLRRSLRKRARQSAGGKKQLIEPFEVVRVAARESA